MMITNPRLSLFSHFFRLKNKCIREAYIFNYIPEAIATIPKIAYRPEFYIDKVPEEKSMIAL